METTVAGTEFVIDAQRTCLQERFFTVFSFEMREELHAAISEMHVGLDTIVRSEDSLRLVYSGWVYWFLFLKGYLDFADVGEISEDNVYLDYLIRYYAPRGHDAGLVLDLTYPEATYPERVRDRARKRFSLMTQAAAGLPGNEWDIDPVDVVVGDPSPHYPLSLFPVESAEPLEAKLVDGWHRLFAARVWGIPSLPGRVIREKEEDETGEHEEWAA